MPRTAVISDAARDVLARAAVVENAVRLPEGRLSPNLYRDVVKVIETLGGKWDRKRQAHVFANAVGDRLAVALEEGRAKRDLEHLNAADARRQRIVDLQFFQTPGPVGTRMAQWVRCRGKRILEPSAGHGRLVRAALQEGAAGVAAVEVDGDNCAVLETIAGPVSVTRRDFLTCVPGEVVRYDGVLMNPPFAGDQDIQHVRHAWAFLARGGRLAAVVSGHALHARGRVPTGFREWLAFVGAGIERLPEGTFSDEGTHASAALVLAEKVAD